MMGRPGTAARIFSLLAEKGVNIKAIILSVSEAGISFVVAGSQAPAAKSALEASMLRSGEARRVDVEDQVAIIAVIGSNMKGHPGTAARVFSAVGRSKINVIAIAQGSSELSITFMVRGEEGPGAVRALHEEFLK